MIQGAGDDGHWGKQLIEGASNDHSTNQGGHSDNQGALVALEEPKYGSEDATHSRKEARSQSCVVNVITQ
jgi:hypothetical protein